MQVKIKSPEVARRLRGMGGTAYVIDAGKESERIIVNARHFSPKGFDMESLCREGRLAICMAASDRSNRESRRLVEREIQRQTMRTSNRLKEEEEHLAEQSERYPTDAEWEVAHASKETVDVWWPFIPSDS